MRFRPTNLSAATTCALLLMANASYFSCPVIADPPGWKLVWEDDFQQLDTDRWNIVTSHEPTNESLQAYLPSQVSVEDGKLVILSEAVPSGDLAYRSGQVKSKSAQRYGRWEIRAKLPTTQGMWPAIWLLPDVDEVKWPSGGEIDIMENRGNQPCLTSSAFHFGTNPPYRHEYIFGEHQAIAGSQLIDFTKDFHTYAVDWTEDSVRFYVDDVVHSTMYDEDVGGFISSSTKPMELVINTAVGGGFLPNPDSSTVWPQRFEIDWVRVYQAVPNNVPKKLVNGSFEDRGGTLAGWTVFNNKVPDNPNIRVAAEAVRDGSASLKLFGTFGAGGPYSGVTQGISVKPGQDIAASLDSFIRSDDSIADTDNSVAMKIEFYSKADAKFGSDAMLGVEELLVADGETANDLWHSHTLSATAPSGAAEARLTIVFYQPTSAAGAVHIDNIRFGEKSSATSRPTATTSPTPH